MTVADHIDPWDEPGYGEADNDDRACCEGRCRCKSGDGDHARAVLAAAEVALLRVNTDHTLTIGAEDRDRLSAAQAVLCRLLAGALS